MGNLLQTSVRNMLREAFDGPPNPRETWFTNNEANSGIFGVLGALSAEEASTLVHGNTLAAHANHVQYHLSGTNELLETGKYPKMDWGMSWATTSVTAQEWEAVQAAVQHEYARLMRAIECVGWSEEMTNEVLASLAHSAYHLGAMRQMLKSIKDA